MKKHFYIVIADVHGKAEMLEEALEKSRMYVGTCPYTVVFLGDLIDRGGKENEVLRIVKEEVEAGAILLMGNHDYFLVGTGNGDPREAHFWDLNDGWATCVRMFGLVEQKTMADLQQLREWLFARGMKTDRVHEACFRTTMSWKETIRSSWQYELLNQAVVEHHTKRIYFCHAPQMNVKDWQNISPRMLMWGDHKEYQRLGELDSLFKVPGNFRISVHGHIHKLGIDHNFPRTHVYSHGGASRTVVLADSGCGCGTLGRLHPVILSETDHGAYLEAIL